MPRTFSLTESVNTYESVQTSYQGFCPYKGEGEYIALIDFEGTTTVWELDWEWWYNPSIQKHVETCIKSLNQLLKFYEDQGIQGIKVKVAKITIP